MDSQQSSSISAARDYYNSPSADTIYHSIWGGNDIHIGFYSSGDESITIASQRSVERMAEMVAASLTPSARVLDLGSGYGGAARYLARKYGCKVTCLNLSEVQNERNRSMTAETKLDHLVKVEEGNFERLPFADGSFDVIWSQDSFLHSSNRRAVVGEISRVLIRGGGVVVFTDPMAAAAPSEDVLAPLKQRLSISTFGSRAFYENEFKAHGFTETSFESSLEHLVTHYSKVLQAIKDQHEILEKTVPAEVLERFKAGLRTWIAGGEQGHLDWGIFLFER